MLKIRYYVPVFALLVVSMSGCAGTNKASKAPNPLVGLWDFSIDTPQGEERGTITFEEVEGVLSGTLSSNMPAGTAMLEALAFDASTSSVTFAFETGSDSTGRITVNAVIEGDTLTGTMKPSTMDLTVPMVASRKMEADE